MPETPVEVTQFRLTQVEQGLKEMRGDLKEAVGTLGGGLTALQTQLTSYQQNISERYVSRRDFENRNNELDERLKQLDSVRDQGAIRMWMAISAIGTLGSLAVGAIGWLRPLH